MSLRSLFLPGSRFELHWLLTPAVLVGVFAAAIIVILSDTGAVAHPLQPVQAGAGSGGTASPVPSASEVFANWPQAEVPPHIQAF